MDQKGLLLAPTSSPVVATTCVATFTPSRRPSQHLVALASFPGLDLSCLQVRPPPSRAIRVSSLLSIDLNWTSLCVGVASSTSSLYIYILYTYRLACVRLCAHVYVYIYIYICMYIYIYVCVCVCMNVFMYVCMSVCLSVCLSVCMHACMYACMYLYMYICMYVAYQFISYRIICCHIISYHICKCARVYPQFISILFYYIFKNDT